MKLPDKHLRGMHCPWALLRQTDTCSRQAGRNPTIRANPRHYNALALGEASLDPQPDTPTVLKTSERRILEPKDC